MATATASRKVIIDGSRLMIESLARSGADVFIGYPITPANLLYSYAHERFPHFFAAPDEITTLQWMCGFATTGKFPVTATSFPGYALMLESVNMAYMMELPMVIILAQRLGPATGTATCGAQGDLALLHGSISGGMSLPVISVSNLNDCWLLASKAMKMAVELRTPVVLLTSKEEIMTQSGFDISTLTELETYQPVQYNLDERYLPYLAGESLVPSFLPVGNRKHQVRYTASTHDTRGIIQNVAKEAIDNTRRLEEKLQRNLSGHTWFEYNRDEKAKVLVASYGITSQAAREAIRDLRAAGTPVSHLIMKTLLPVPPQYLAIMKKYEHIIVAEENLTGQYKSILFGTAGRKAVSAVNAFAKMITPSQIANAVKKITGGIV